MIFLEQQKFLLGRIVITPSALKALNVDDICRAIDSHVCGDWGLLDGDDRAANELALRIGGRLLSEFQTAQGIRFWVLTEADRTRRRCFCRRIIDEGNDAHFAF